MAYTDRDVKVAFRQLFNAAGFSSSDASDAADEIVDTLDTISVTTTGSITAGTTVAAGTTVTGATGVTATTGGVTATAGGVTATAGGVTATAGDITAAADNVVATLGDITATAGAVAAGTTVTGGTGVVATTGGVTATDGGVTATAGGLTVTAGDSSFGAKVAIGDNSTLTKADELEVVGGDVFVNNVGTLGAECLIEGDFSGHANWDVTGDWDDSANPAAYTWASNTTSTLTQTAAKQVTGAGLIPNHWYKMTYVIAVTTAPDGDSATTLTTGVAAAAQAIDVTAGAKTLYFKSAAAPANFVISTVVSDGTEGTFTIDDIVLKPVLGGYVDCGSVQNNSVFPRRKVWKGINNTPISIDVAGIGILDLDSSTAEIVVGGLTGGTVGQVLHILVSDGTNNVTLEDMEGDDQDIETRQSADLVFTGVSGGTTLIFDGTTWVELGNAVLEA